MRILLTLDDGEQWVGDLHARDEVNHNVVLSNPERCASGKQFKGLHTFRDDEISQVEDLKEEIEANTTPKQDKENLSTKRRLNLVMEEKPKGPQGVVKIDRLNDEFFKALREISQERVIGLAVEGRMMGRNGKLCCLQIKADTFVYIFDMMHQAKEFFMSGLKDVIEDPKILKIMHNSRFVSDALYHLYGILLNNVFDTQAADIIIRKNNMRGKMPGHVRDLGTCLRDYLSIKPDELSLLTAPLHPLEKDQLALMKRPMTDQVVDAAVDSVQYLRELRLEMMQRLFKEVEEATDFFLNYVRDSTPREIALMSPNEVPERMKLLARGQRDLLAPQRTAESSELPSLPDWTPVKTSANQTLNPFTLTTEYLKQRMDALESCDDDDKNETNKILNFSSNFLPQSLSNSPRGDAASHPPSTAHDFRSPRSSKPETTLPTSGNPCLSSTTKPKPEPQSNHTVSRGLKGFPAGLQATNIPKNLAKWERWRNQDII